MSTTSKLSDIELTWGGEEKKIPATNVLSLIAQLEEIVSVQRLLSASEDNEIPIAKISQCYGLVLRHAGFTANDDEVYEKIITGGAPMATAIVSALIYMLLPNSMIEKASSEFAKEGIDLPGKSKAPTKRKASTKRRAPKKKGRKKSALSKSHTKRSSAPVKSDLVSSGT